TLLRYLAVLLAFALGLMAKPMLVTLPCVMLLLDYWPLRRLRPFDPDGRSLPTLLLEKLPLGLLAALSAAVTLGGQASSAAVAPLDALPLGMRLANAAVVPLVYLKQTIWPTGLACFYPHPARVSAEAQAALLRAALPSAAALVAVTALLVRLGRRWRYLSVGWLSYLGMLVPVLGLVQVGDQAMADRYTYLPMIGVYVAAVWGVADLAAAWPAALRKTLALAA